MASEYNVLDAAAGRDPWHEKPSVHTRAHGKSVEFLDADGRPMWRVTLRDDNQLQVSTPSGDPITIELRTVTANTLTLRREPFSG